jgi:hypothetical protein
MKTSEDRRIQSQGRLLYTLLDAACEAGLLTGGTAARWQETKTRIICGATYEGEARAFHKLLDELAMTGALSGSWIDSRWRALEACAEAD